MNRDDVLRLAMEAGATWWPDKDCSNGSFDFIPSNLYQFADLLEKRLMDELMRCPHCDRTLEDETELQTGLCTSDDCPRHDKELT
jgi:hypothetical protein